MTFCRCALPLPFLLPSSKLSTTWCRSFSDAGRRMKVSSVSDSMIECPLRADDTRHPAFCHLLPTTICCLQWRFVTPRDAQRIFALHIAFASLEAGLSITNINISKLASLQYPNITLLPTNELPCRYACFLSSVARLWRS